MTVCSLFLGFKKLHTFRKLLIGLFLVAIASRGLTWYWHTGFEFFDIHTYRFEIYRPFHTHFDGLIIGLLIATLIVDKSFKLPQFFNRPALYLSAAIIVGASLTLTSKVLFTLTGVSLVSGSVVWMSLTSSNWITRILSFPLFFWTAKVSFGVYLVHVVVLDFLNKSGWFNHTLFSSEFHLILTFLVTFLISCLLSSVTYILIEAPTLKLRDKKLSQKP